jgi:thiol-disulfide isomerase/thioredoxin
MKWMRNLWLPGLVAAVVAFAFLANPISAGDDDTGTVPELKAKTLDGKMFDLEKQRGKVVVLNFWATWCGPCVKEIPDFIELQKKYKKKGLVFVGVSVDKTESPVKQFVKKQKVNYPMLMTSEKIWERFQKLVPENQRNAVPVTFLVDRKGKIRGKHIGSVERKELEKELTPLLQEKVEETSSTGM